MSSFESISTYFFLRFAYYFPYFIDIREYYSYFMPFCSIVQTITPRYRGQPEALLHEAEGRVQ